MAKRVIGATIKLDGEAQFKRSVAACNSELKTMKSEMALVSEQFKGNANSIEALTAKQSTLEKTLSASQKVVDETAKALANAKDNYSRAGESLEGYKKSLEDAQKALAEMKSSGSASADEIKKQEQQIAMLEATIEKGEGAYDRAGKAVQEWQRRLNTSQTEVVKLERELSDTGKYLDEAKKSSDGFAHSIDGMGKKVSASAGETSGAVEKLGSDIGTYFKADKLVEYADRVSQAFREMTSAVYEATKEIDQGMDTIVKKTGATGKDLEGYRDIFNDLYGSLPMDADKVGAAIGEVSTQFSGLDDKTIEKLSDRFLKFAHVNDSDVSQSVSGVQSVLKSFNKDASEADELMDVMTKSGQSYGVAMDKVMSSMVQNSAAMREIGADMYQSVDFISRLEKSGVDSSAVLSGLKRAYTSAAKDGKDFRTVLMEVQDTLQNSGDSAVANQKAYDLFGKSFANVSQAVKDGRLDFADLADSMSLVSGAAGTVDETFKGTQSSWDEMQTAMHNLDSATSELTQELLSSATPAIDGMVDLLQEVNGIVKGMPQPIKMGTAAIGGVTVALGILAPKIAGIVISIKALQAAGVAGGLGTTLTEAGAGATTLATSLGTVAGPAAAVVAAFGAMAVAAEYFSSKAVDANDSLQGFLKGTKEETSEAQKAIDEFYSHQEQRAGQAVTAESVAQMKAQKAELVRQRKEYQKALKEQRKDAEKEQKKVKDDFNKDSLKSTAARMMTSPLETLFPAVGAAHTVYDMTNIRETQKSSKKITNAIKENEEAVKGFSEAEKKASEEIKAAEAALAQQEKRVTSTTGSLNFSASATDEQREKALSTLDTYGVLIDRIREYHGDVDAIRESIGEDDTALQAVFDQTVGAWQTAHDQIMDGLGEEVQSLADSAKQWQEYKKSVEESVKSPASMFQKMDYDDSQYWGKMTEGMEANASQYEHFNEHVKQILESTRYQTDETFREIANRIMTGGIENQGYLDAFVSSVDLSTKEATDDIRAFTDFSSAADRYSGTMTALAQGTEETMSGVAEVWDTTRTTAEQAMDALSDKMQQQAEMYSAYSDNVNNIVNSDRYQQDEQFRNFANLLLQQGIAGADSISALWEGMQTGSDYVDQMMDSFGRLTEAKSEFADVSASIQTSLQDGMNGSVQIINDAGEAWRLGMVNSSDLLIAGLDTNGLVTKYQTGMNQIQTTTDTEMAVVKDQMAQSGKDMVNNLAHGMLSQIPMLKVATEQVAATIASMLHHSTPSEGPLAGDDKWGEELGQNFAKGLASTDAVAEKAALGYADSVAGEFDSLNDLSFNGVSVEGGATAGGGVNMTVNVYGTEGQDVRVLADLVSDRIRYQLQGVR